MASQVPSYLVCPLTNKLFQDPVQTLYGTVYDRVPLTAHIHRFHCCPQTGKPLHLHMIFTDTNVAKLLEDHLISEHKKSTGEIKVKNRAVTREKLELGEELKNISVVTSPTSPKSPTRIFSGSSTYARNMMSTGTFPGRAISPDPAITAPIPRWFRTGNNRWKIYNDGDNQILEESYQNGIQITKLSGTHATVNIPERVQISNSGTKRFVIRGTYFIQNGKEWFPLDEDTVEIIEQDYLARRWNAKVPFPDKKHYLVLKSETDIRRYVTGKNEYIHVTRGFSTTTTIPRAKKSRNKVLSEYNQNTL